MKFVVLLLLAGCTASNIEHSSSRFPNGSSPALVCLEGVKYYAYQNAFAPAYNVDGTIKTCGETK